MIKRVFGLLSIGLMVAFASTAQADIFFDVDSSTGTTFAPGGSGTLTFFIATTGGDVGTAMADTWQLSFEVSATGGANIADLSFTNSPSAPVGNVWEIGPNVLNDPFTSTGTSLTPETLGARTDMFTLDFMISGGAPAVGNFDFDIVAQDTSATFDTKLVLGGTNLTIDFSAAPELSLGAIPEPTGALLLLGCVGGLIATNRRRRVS